MSGNFAGHLRQSQKMETLGILAGGIVHDFNNILTIIGAHASLALGAGPTTAVRTSLDEINRALFRAKNLADRILVYSKQQEDEHKAVELPEVVDEALSLLRAALPRRVTVRATYAADLPMVFADASQIHQVMV